MSVRIFIEGGGSPKSMHLLRLGFQEFFRNGLPNRQLPKIEMCGSRTETYKDFCNSLNNSFDNFCLLLVDSEGPVTTPSPWDHLTSIDGWGNPGVTDDNCHLMVQIMESWFVADVNSLRSYYGRAFLCKHIPNNLHVESIDKNRILKSLEMATHRLPRKIGLYHKIKHASDLLKRLDVRTVRLVAPHCDRLFTVLEKLI